MYLIHPVSLIEGTVPSLNNVSFTWVHACQGTSQVALVIKNLPAGAGDIRELSSVSGSGRSSGGVCAEFLLVCFSSDGQG